VNSELFTVAVSCCYSVISECLIAILEYIASKKLLLQSLMYLPMQPNLFEQVKLYEFLFLQDEEDDLSQLPSLDRLCHVGMLLPCSVTSIQGKHVSVSVDPALVNASITTSSVKQGLVRGLLGGVELWCDVLCA